jgi:uncharacterized protein
MACWSNALKRLLFFLLIWAGPGLAWGVTPPLPAQPPQYVVDLARVIDAATQARLNGLLRDLEAKTTAQVVILTINSLDGEPLASFSHQTAVKWGIGRKGKDNGVLLTVAVKDHKYRLEVGYGLESTLPDSLVGSLGRQYLVPNFRKGDYAAGLVAVATALADKISGGKVVSKAGAGIPSPLAKSARQPGARGSVNPLTAILLLIFILLFTINIFRKARRGGGGGFFWFGGGGGGWSSGGSSGGFSGGGGDFGGGGASGDW